MGKMGDDIAIEAHYMVINFTMVIVGSFVQCSLIAEEKEKNTLRGLMLVTCFDVGNTRWEKFIKLDSDDDYCCNRGFI